MIAQVNEIVDDPKDLKRVDIPGSWVDYVVKADRPFFIEPLFTRDPRQIKDAHILMAMMALKGIYAPHEVESLNHASASTLPPSNCSFQHSAKSSASKARYAVIGV